jgi:hypothetical protein
MYLEIIFRKTDWVSLIQNAWDQCILNLGILEYLNIHKEICWGWDPRLNTEFVYVLYPPYMHSLKAILYNILMC